MTDEQLHEELERVRRDYWRTVAIPAPEQVAPLAHPDGPKLGAYASDDPVGHTAMRDIPLPEIEN